MYVLTIEKLTTVGITDTLSFNSHWMSYCLLITPPLFTSQLKDVQILTWHYKSRKVWPRAENYWGGQKREIGQKRYSTKRGLISLSFVLFSSMVRPLSPFYRNLIICAWIHKLFPENREASLPHINLGPASGCIKGWGGTKIERYKRFKDYAIPASSIWRKFHIRCGNLFSKKYFPDAIHRVYRGPRNGFYVVGRNFFLLLLNCYAWPCLGPAFQGSLYFSKVFL